MANLDRTAKFYEDLGFIVTDKTPDYLSIRLNWFWVEFVRQDKAEETVFQPVLAVESGDNGKGQFVHISVTNVDEFYKHVLEKGMKPSSKPKDFRWGRREFILPDPDGYKLVFFNKGTKK